MTPFKIASSCSKLSALRPETINEVLKFWEGEEQGYVTAGKESVAHTLTVQQGTLQFQSDVKHIFDKDFLTVFDGREGLTAETTTASLFGISGSYSSGGLVSISGLGEMRLVTQGELLVLAVDTHELVKTLKELDLLKAGKFTEWQSVMSLTEGLSIESATALRSGTPKTNIWNISVKAGELIYIPAGWLVRMADAKPGLLSGLRMSFLPSTSATQPLVAACALDGVDQNVKDDIDAMLNALSKEKSD